MPGSNLSKEGAAPQRILVAWTLAAQRHAVLVAAFIGVLTTLAGWYTANNLGVKTSTTDMISAETPFRRDAIEFDNAFPQFRNLIVAVIDAPISDSARLAARRLADGLALRSDLFSHVDAQKLNRFFRQNGLLFLDVAALDALADRLARAEPFLAGLAHQPNLSGLLELLEGMMKAPRASLDYATAAGFLNNVAAVAEAQAAGRAGEFSWRAMFDPNLKRDRRYIVVAQPKQGGDALRPAGEALAEIRRQSNAITADNASGVVIRLTGSVALDHEELQSVEFGGKMSGLLSLTLIIVLLVFGLRSFRLVLPTLLTLIVGLIWTATFAAVAVGHLNLISVAFAVLFIGLGVDFSIHYCLRFRQHGGDGAALPRTTAAVSGSLAIGAACAAIGFLSFVPTEYRGLAELGLISAGGMAIAFFLNVTLLPALLAVGKCRTMPELRSAQWHGNFAQRYFRSILIGATLVAFAAAATLPHLRFDFNPMNLKDPATESVAAFFDLAGEDGNAVYALDVLAADQKSASRVGERLRALPEVGKVLTLDSYLPKNQAEKLTIIQDISYFLLPALSAPAVPEHPDPATALYAFKSTLSEFLQNNHDHALFAPLSRLQNALGEIADGAHAAALEHRLTTHLQPLLDELNLFLAAEPVHVDSIPADIKNAWVAPDSRVRVQIWPAKPIFNNKDLRQFARTVGSIAPSAVGTPITITEAGGTVVAAFQQASLIALILVTAVLLFVLRSVADTGLVLAPLLLAALLTGATSVLLDLPFNFANVIVLPLLFGLGVASGVHLVVAGRRAPDAAALLQSSTPRAVLFSALTTIASFGSLALSGHRGMTSMGQLLTVAIGYTLICTLIVLPALMTWREQRGK